MYLAELRRERRSLDCHLKKCLFFFQLTIKCKKTAFSIKVNGTKKHTFKYKVSLQQINLLEAEGDVSLTTVFEF